MDADEATKEGRLFLGGKLEIDGNEVIFAEMGFPPPSGWMQWATCRGGEKVEWIVLLISQPTNRHCAHPCARLTWAETKSVPYYLLKNLDGTLYLRRKVTDTFNQFHMEKTKIAPPRIHSSKNTLGQQKQIQAPSFPMGKELDRSDPSWPILWGGQDEDLDPSLVNFL